jgi:hypothetical protein
MSHHGIVKRTWLGLAIVASPAFAHACGPGEAARGPGPGQSVEALPTGADFVVLIWYRRADPLGTFQYQMYDLRKHEYTAAVDDWLREMSTKFPGYVVEERAVDLGRERGETEKLKVGSVIHRELMIVAAQSGIILGPSVRTGSSPNAGPSPSARTTRPARPLQTDRSYLVPSGPSFPVPMPYPRPHP